MKQKLSKKHNGVCNFQRAHLYFKCNGVATNIIAACTFELQ